MSMMFYGLRMNVGRMPGDVFTNYMILEGVEIPARLISLPLLGRLGRRWFIGIFCLSAGVCMFICIPFLMNTGWSYNSVTGNLTVY